MSALEGGKWYEPMQQRILHSYHPETAFHGTRLLCRQPGYSVSQYVPIV